MKTAYLAIFYDKNRHESANFQNIKIQNLN